VIELTLHVPDVSTRPVVGTSCCVTTAEAAIAQELWLLGGIDDFRLEEDQATLWVRLDEGQTSPEALRASLADIGYPAAD
jgi:hypothetical protein